MVYGIVIVGFIAGFLAGQMRLYFMLRAQLACGVAGGLWFGAAIL